MFYLLLNILHKYRKAMRTIVIVAFVLVSCQAEREDQGFSGERALRYIERQLAFGPRYPGSPGHVHVQEWLVAELSGMGWSVERQRFEHQGVVLTNIVATHPGSTDATTVLIGAHYDTRQYADRDLLNPGLPVPGANDGASGVAVLLELADVFSEGPPIGLTLAFFDAEDQGRLDGWDWDVGSQYFVEQLHDPPQAVVIIDMIGDKDLNLPYERSSDPALVETIWGVAADLGHQAFVEVPGPSMIDDHIPFIQAQIPAVLIIDFTYPYWHTTSDDIDKVSAESLYVIGSTLESWLNSYVRTLDISP